MVLTPRSHKRWLHKRKLTIIAFAFENVLIGSEFSLTFLTLWLYITEMVKPSNPKVYYSIISASYLIGSMSLSIILGRIVDRYRKVRTTFLILNMFVVIGNMIYTLPFSPVCLVIGRLISGLGGPLRSVVSGELARCFPKNELSRKFSIMGMSYSVGFVAGPGVNFMFKHLDIYIGKWHITYVNAPGLFLAFMFFIAVIMSYFMIFDLSNEYDLKADSEYESFTETLYLKHTNDSEETVIASQDDSDCTDVVTRLANSYMHYNSCYKPQSESDTIGRYQVSESDTIDKYQVSEIDTIEPYQVSENPKITVSYIQLTEETPLVQIRDKYPKQIAYSENVATKKEEIPSIGNVLIKLFTNFDTCLLLLCAFFENYFVVSFDIWLPLLIIDVMKWSIVELNVIIFGTGICCVGACILMICKPFSDSSIYIIAIFTTFSIIIMEGMFMILAHYNNSLPLNIILFVLFDFFYCFLVITEEVFLVGCLAKMVSSRIQTFVDSIRLSMYRLGGLTALATSALIFDWILVVSVVHITIVITGIILLIVRHKTLRNPSLVIK